MPQRIFEAQAVGRPAPKAEKIAPPQSTSALRAGFLDRVAALISEQHAGRLLTLHTALLTPKSPAAAGDL
jgi:hypothetical protein